MAYLTYSVCLAGDVLAPASKSSRLTSRRHTMYVGTRFYDFAAGVATLAESIVYQGIGDVWISKAYPPACARSIEGLVLLEAIREHDAAR